MNIYRFFPEVETLMGDVNFDEEIDVLDIVMVVNFVLSTIDPTSDQYIAADVNNDNVIDVLDIVIIINLILG